MQVIQKSALKGVVAEIILIVIYFIIVSFVSGWEFAKDQFSQFWYYIVALSLGFGIQVGLYNYLRSMIKETSPKLIATTGATSTVAMISCCAHYLVNILPILGIAGIITIISQYQIQLFWIGLAFNFLGIAYMGNKVYKFLKGI